MRAAVNFPRPRGITGGLPTLRSVRAGVDPPPEERRLRVAQALAGGRHHLELVLGGDPPQDLTAVGGPGHHSRLAGVSPT